jgi:myo-inositol 2-dehydrogenase / D-chiro-inositol 1-dehydrogenase
MGQDMSGLKVGLLGFGKIAQSVHLNVLMRLPGVELVAIAETDAKRRDEAHQAAPTAALFSDYRETLRMPQLDAVVICLPNALHAEAVSAAFAERKHVYVEKPLATDLEAGRNMVAEWRRSGKVGMIGFNYRYNSLYRSLRQQLLSGRIGNPIAVRSVFSTVRSNIEGWRAERKEGGGVLLDLASHHIDLCRYLFGKEFVDVSASVRSVHRENDTAVLQMHLADGMFFQSFFSLSTLEEDCIEVYGESGKLAVDRYRSVQVDYSAPMRKSDRFLRLGSSAGLITNLPYIFRKLRAPGNEVSYQEALAHFVAGARSGENVSPDFEDGYRSLAVVLAAEESAAVGRVLNVPQMMELQ